MEQTSHPRTFRLFSLLWTFLLCWNWTVVKAQTSAFSLNPVTNFCSRWWSQSVIKNDVLYIDSGVQKWNGTDINFGPPKGDVYYIDYGIMGINNYLITIPMNFSWDWQKDIIINSQPKNETNPATGTLPPSRMRGHMFHGPTDSSDVFVYGGTVYMGNQSFAGFRRPDATTYSLWGYNPNATGYPWSQYDISQPWMSNHGAAAEATDQGLGFYLNGQIDWGTSAGTLNALKHETDYRALEGMLVIDFHNHTSRNISASGIRGNAPRIGGTMEYFPSIGGMGVLVAVGGQINQQQPWANMSEGELVDFTAVDVFDIDSYLQNPSHNGTWYQQNTTGDIPPARIDFCTVSISTPDNSSHHIYMYGGHVPKENITASDAFDDVYVLTIPSFTWTAVFTGGASPRWGHNCHIAGKRQMITVGGNITNTGLCDWEAKGVAFLEMTTVTWGSVFLTNTTEFEVPQKLLEATGGTSQGGATIKEPGAGWTGQGLQKVFNTTRKWGSSETSPNPAHEGKKSHAGAIAGGVVGGVAGLVLIASALFFLRRRHDKAKKAHELPNDEIRRQELGEDKKKSELQGINENDPAELPGPEPKELSAPRQFVEADHDTVTAAAELSGTSVVPGGKTGVPVVRTPGDDLPTPPLYTPGLVRPQSRDRSSPPGSPREPSQVAPKEAPTEDIPKQELDDHTEGVTNSPEPTEEPSKEEKK